MQKNPLEVIFTDEYRKNVRREFFWKRLATVLLCMVIFVVSQYDLQLSKTLITRDVTEDSGVAMTQTIHLTTALSLFTLAIFLEYSNKTDYIVFFINLVVAGCYAM